MEGIEFPFLDHFVPTRRTIDPIGYEDNGRIRDETVVPSDIMDLLTIKTRDLKDFTHIKGALSDRSNIASLLVL